MRKILLLIILISGFCLAQNQTIISDWSKSPFYTVTATTETHGIVGNYEIITGDTTTVETTRQLGSQQFDPYMRWWLDSTDVMINGTYDTDLTGLYLGGIAPKYYGSDYDGIGRINCVLDSIKNILNVPFRTDNDLWDVDNSNGFTTLQVSFLYYIPSSNTTLSRVAIRFQNISNSHDTLYPYFEGYDEWLTASADITVSEPQGDLYFWPNLGIGETTVGDKFYIDNVEVYWVADSVQTLAHPLLISDLTEDTTYNYDCVAVPIRHYGLYSDGLDSTFTTALSPPNSLRGDCADDYKVELDWEAGTTRNAYGTAILRKNALLDVDPTRIDTVAYGTTSYTDSANGLELNETYAYSLINLGYHSESIVSASYTVLIDLPGGQFDFEPTSINYANIDSTSGDSSKTVLAINNSGVDITISSVSGVSPPLTVILPSAFPIIVLDTDTLTLTVSLDLSNVGTHSQTAVFNTNYLNSQFSIYAKINPGEPGVDPPDTTAPNPPTELSATGYNPFAGPTWVNVSWKESTSKDRAGLRLYATGINDPEGSYSFLIALTEGTTEYNDYVPGAGQSRGYYITQLDDSSNESNPSNTDTVTVPADSVCSPPNAPSNLTSTILFSKRNDLF